MTTDKENNSLEVNKEERSKSIISDESSDLSDLDSEAETEKMYSGTESKLKKLAKVDEADEDITHEANDEDETTIQPKDDSDDQFIKDEIIEELSDHKNEEVTTPLNDEEISNVVAENGSNKRKLDDEEEKKEEEEEDKRQKISGSDNEMEEDEAGDEEEDEENDHIVEEEVEDDEEEELTEEQKELRKKELEIELEKQKERSEALEFLTEIEVDFAKLRDRLYDDKMERFKSELAMCLNGSHPELQTVYTKIDSHREEKTKLAELDRKYKLESITRTIIAQRTQVHQQFYKLVFDAKNKLLKDITEEWYKINKERRTMDLLVPEYSYKIPDYNDELVYQRQQLNEEISLLVGLNHYYGFPTAPKLKSVQGDELNDDLRAMNIPL